MGYLDKGAKWNKKDWWRHHAKNQTTTDDVKTEQKEVKRRDDILMAFKLKNQGLAYDTRYDDILNRCSTV